MRYKIVDGHVQESFWIDAPYDTRVDAECDVQSGITHNCDRCGIHHEFFDNELNVKEKTVYPNNALGFEIWKLSRDHKGVEFSHCLAAFYYWQECLDFKDYCLARGSSVVIRTLQPSGLEYRSEHRHPEVK